MREINRIVCSCGGAPVEVDPTDEEEASFGCSRRGCCVTAFECPGCRTRFTFALAAPDMD